MALPSGPVRYRVVPLIGPDGAGKTSLIQALGSYVQRREGLPVPPLRTVQASGSSALVLDSRTPRGVLQHVDFPSASVEAGLLAATPFQGAVLVVSALDGPLPGTASSLRHVRERGVARIAVALTKCDVVEDPEILDLIEMEVRDLLVKHECDGDSAPVGRVAGYPMACEGERWMAAIAGFGDAVERWVP